MKQFKVTAIAIQAWLLGFTAVCALATTCAAQDPFGNDPFGGTDTNPSAMDPGDAFGTPSSDTTAPAATTAANGSYLQTDPLIRRVRQNPPQTPSDMAKAITWMVQLRSWSDVGALLDNYAALNWPVPQQAELARGISPNIWVHLQRASAKLSETQLASLRGLYRAPATYAREPNVISGLIEQLSSDDSATRQVAELRLQDGGQIALSQIVNQLASGGGKVAPARLASAALRFDAEGIDALRAACALPSEHSARVLQAIAESDSSQFRTEMAGSLYAANLSPEAKHALGQTLSNQFSRLPTEGVAADFVSRAVAAALAEYQSQRALDSQIMRTVWRPNPDGSVAAQSDSTTASALERLAQLSCLQSQMQSATSVVQSASAAIQLQRAYQLNPSLVDAELQSRFLRPLPETQTSNVSFWTECFRQADRWQMHGAAVRCLQMLTAEIRRGQVLPPLTFLSELLTDPRPVIRYAALEAIIVADPHEDFAGSAQALTAAIEMSQLSQGPQSLIIGGNTELCMAADELVRQFTSTQSIIAGSAREAFMALSNQNPIEFIMVVDRVHDMNLYELLQRLRNSGSLPIAVLVEHLQTHEVNFATTTAGVHKSFLSRDPEQMQRTLDNLMGSLDVKPMSVDDRLRLATDASAFLTKVAGDRATYGFYPVTAWHQELISARRRIAPIGQAQLLSGLGTAESQAGLAQLICTAGLSPVERAAAANAFAKSVRQFGLQLNDREVTATYEQYNKFGPNDPAIATAMGHVLDVIEAQAGTREWPKPL